MDRNITIEKVGIIAYYSYKLFKFLTVLLNTFVIYFYFNGNPKFIILSLILNSIYIVIYIHRFWIIIPSMILSFFLTKNIYYAIVIGFCIGNTISYIIDFIVLTIMSSFMNFLERMSKK